MIKEDPRVSSAQAWGCPHASPINIQVTQASKLGDAPVHPLLHQQSSVRPSSHYIFITSCVMCFSWSVSLFGFFSLALLAVQKKLDPILLCVGEKHVPLSKSRTHHRILHAYLFAVVCSLSFHIYFHV